MILARRLVAVPLVVLSGCTGDAPPPEARDATGGGDAAAYAQRLQLGTLTMRITAGASGRPPTIVLLEHLPHRLSVYEAAYAGPDSATVVTRFQREVDPRGETASPRFQ